MPANGNSAHGGVCAYVSQTNRVYACPAPDPGCWAWYQTCGKGDAASSSQIYCTGSGTSWCCTADETCTPNVGQINICVSAFGSPNSGESLAIANSVELSALGVTTITATSETATPTPFSSAVYDATGTTTSSSSISSTPSSSSTSVGTSSSSLVSTSPSRTTSSQTSSASGAASASSTTIPVSSNRSKSGLSGGAIAGIVIGSVAGVTIIASLFFLWGKQHAGSSTGGANPPELPSHVLPQQQNMSFNEGLGLNELPSASANAQKHHFSEMPGSEYQRPQELEGMVQYR
ncbi:hypothetical protein BP6252_07050 [Coleophoma cylindrospora]|uniref:Mid2 domain-containing protein n=1 Tax=Coleophoma cylindrospora TaxID=1849047 RepID=A0A3D8RGE8_9HELO|nr:hypothetical protein BP6252_07050 [Coleophoma cylindrospora]